MTPRAAFVSLCYAITCLALVACAVVPTPQPLPDAYPPPRAPTPVSTSWNGTSIVVAEIISRDDYLELVPYPAEATRYARVIVPFETEVRWAGDTLAEERPAVLADVIVNSLIDVAGTATIVGDMSGTAESQIIAEWLVIRESGTAAVPATPRPEWIAGLGYPSPSGVPVGTIMVPAGTPLSTPVDRNMCNDCSFSTADGQIQLVGVVAERQTEFAATRLMLLPAAAYQVSSVMVYPDTQITFEDGSAAKVEDLAAGVRIDVVADVENDGDVRAQYIIVLTPRQTSSPAQAYP